MKTVLGNHLCRDLNYDSEILSFYALFLTNDINYITVPSYSYFRLLVHSLLNTKVLFHNPIYMTDQPTNEFIDIRNIYKELDRLLKNSKKSSDEQLYDYMLHDFFGDVMFIEQTSTMVLQPWYKNLIRFIELNRLHNRIPIIIASEG